MSTLVARFQSDLKLASPPNISNFAYNPAFFEMSRLHIDIRTHGQPLKSFLIFYHQKRKIILPRVISHFSSLPEIRSSTNEIEHTVSLSSKELIVVPVQTSADQFFLLNLKYGASVPSKRKGNTYKETV